MFEGQLWGSFPCKELTEKTTMKNNENRRKLIFSYMFLRFPSTLAPVTCAESDIVVRLVTRFPVRPIRSCENEDWKIHEFSETHEKITGDHKWEKIRSDRKSWEVMRKHRKKIELIRKHRKS